MSGLPGCSRLIRPMLSCFIKASRTIVAVELAWFRNDTLAATRHANQLARLATQAAIPYWLVLASFCQGLAASTAGDFTEADGFFQQALDASRRGKAGLEFEARMLAFQADNLMRAGDPRRAGEVAAEAIGVARRKADRLAECHASLVAAEACLTRSGSQYAEEARGLLNRANALIDETGAKAYEPMMLRVRAQASDEKILRPHAAHDVLMRKCQRGNVGARRWVLALQRQDVDCDGQDVTRQLNEVFGNPDSAKYRYAKAITLWNVPNAPGNWKDLIDAYEYAGVDVGHEWSMGCLR